MARSVWACVLLLVLGANTAHGVETLRERSIWQEKLRQGMVAAMPDALPGAPSNPSIWENGQERLEILWCSGREWRTLIRKLQAHHLYREFGPRCDQPPLNPVPSPW